MAASLLDYCGKIAAGYDPCGKTPSVAGIEQSVYAFNKGDFTFTYDTVNPLLITGITRVGTALMYKVIGYDGFDAMSKLVKKKVGPRFTETVSFPLPSNDTEAKKFIINGSSGRQQYIVVNNDKSGNGAIELYGAVNGLQFSENTQRQASDEDMQGAWKIEATNPPQLTEAYPPRSVLIGSGSPTYATTITALDALLVPAA